MGKDNGEPLFSSERFNPLVTDKGTEVCVVRVPKNVDLKSLYNCDITNPTFYLDGVQYTANLQKEENHVIAATPDENGRFSLTNFKSKKTYTISENFPEPIVPKIEKPPRYIVPQMKDIQQRHPIYGTEYIKELKRKNIDIDFSSEVKEEKNSVYTEEVNNGGQPKKKKKKKKERSD
eukprot:TRINITY_DN4843_c0_g1_i9.p1 TRINITY_DN4843_c0_g1~~TRINITY_DN4843_c0_g1_i9.p1  ORF type:complete len:177 (-),score=49.78 TRINITY_DN4843_c0_g1_i9:76-606(-)